jgi:predicted ABC-type ATPase
MPIEEASGIAWNEGRRLLEEAIASRRTFAFETTLGGNSITELLLQAASSGIDVKIWFVGLSSPEHHIARVRSRVRAGGHDIPEAKIRERYETSRLNLIRLLRVAAEVRIFDNSAEGDPKAGRRPSPKLIAQVKRGRVVEVCEPKEVPEWAKPILASVLKPRRWS